VDGAFRDMEISELPIKDVETIKPLWELLNKTHHDNSTHWQSYFEEFTFAERIEYIKKKDRAAIFVARSNTDLAGYCIVSIKGNVGEIDSIYIESRYRRSGVGKRLVQSAEKWFQRNEISEIKVAIVEGNDSVFPFYEQFGFKKFVTIFKRV
jgi:ribosomal protein S18 acetylase RimI-like enzyme